uniref:Receptor L-domain domain-containing protein n=1 Tax=Chromera velia CCMP2878 TaxID=1169474 RepID=A0A0G4HC34_9ALVE|eukprot:Cvel_6201.t1-p1 / transcript=Cvel_6201.t1 / gene=Cvel_6201 / organism=Chromera_velia_CCMP2878 / gene_product=hypothetical protein / transcript_product=hypothetical protein / location=Cvel_scaffold300:56908-58179(+) / protein_length=424 / sequence_SO=supercontig / SO=protein_coding / is_pseudo=false
MGGTSFTCCWTVLLLVAAHAAFSPGSLDKFKGLSPDTFTGLFGKDGDKKTAGNVCGDGVTDLQTEECDAGAENGAPDSFCAANCTFVPEVRCDEDLFINNATTLESFQNCRTAFNVVFELDDTINVVMPNLVYVLGDVEDKSGGTNLMRSLSMPNLIFVNDLIDFSGASEELLSMDFPSLLYVEEIEINGLPKLQSANFPKLISVSDNVEFENMPNFSSFNLDSLQFCDDEFRFNNLPELKGELSLPSLFHVGDFNIKDGTGVETVLLPVLNSLDDLNLDSVPALKRIRAPKLTFSGGLLSWSFDGDVNPVLELCSVPIIEARVIIPQVACADGAKCTVESATSSVCKEESKKTKSGKEDVKGGNLFEGLAKFPSLDGDWGKAGDGLLDLDFDVLGKFGKATGEKEKEKGGKHDNCPNPYPALQ